MPRRTPGRTAIEELVRALIVIAAGLVLGGLTSPAQTVLPDALRPFANSNGGWTMLAFLVVWLVRSRPSWGVLHGVLAFEALVEGYAIVSGLRGYFYATPFGSAYAIAGLIAGPVVGAAAGTVRWGRADARVVATGVLTAILVADGVSAIVRVGDTTGYVYWSIQIALGVAFLALAIVRSRPRLRAALIAVLLVVLAALVYPLATALVLG